MQIGKQYKVESVASKDETRAVLVHPYLNVQQKRVECTNGGALVIVPVEVDEHDVSGFITAEALKLARKKDKFCENATIIANGNLALSDGTSLPRPSIAELGTYPNVDQVVPASDRKIAFKIALNPFLLAELARAMGCVDDPHARYHESVKASVTLEFEDDLSAIKVRCNHGENVIGVIMPCR